MPHQLRSTIMPGGTAILVPPGEVSLTGFVLDEQGDWFEEELPFVRRLVRPGWNCVDVGASYGTYALSMATLVGDGSVVAIEPHPAMADALRRSLAALPTGTNHRLEVCAIGAAEGQGLLSDPKDAELSGLMPDGVHEVAIEQLDDLLDDPESIDFVKLDVEGDGASALAGATRLLASGRSIVQFVIRHGGMHQSRSCAQLMQAGYVVCRVVPGLGLLAPLLPGEPLDPYAINAFAVPVGRMQELAARGLAVGVVDFATPLPQSTTVQGVIEMLASRAWIGRFRPNWAANAIVPGWEHQRRAVAMAVLAEDHSLPAEQRAACLVQALHAVRRALGAGMTGSRLATAARIMCAQGIRSEACRVLEALTQVLQSDDAALLQAFVEPYLLPMAMHEDILFTDVPRMLRCSIMEASSFVPTHSAYFQGASRLQAYEQIARLPERSPRADRVVGMLRRMNQRQAPMPLRL